MQVLLLTFAYLKQNRGNYRMPIRLPKTKTFNPDPKQT